MTIAIELIFSLALILGSAIVFINSIELLGERMSLGHGAIGSVLAAHTRDPAFSSLVYYCRSFYSEEEE